MKHVSYKGDYTSEAEVMQYQNKELCYATSQTHLLLIPENPPPFLPLIIAWRQLCYNQTMKHVINERNRCGSKFERQKLGTHSKPENTEFVNLQQFFFWDH